jgi:hypothetical protein
MWSGPRNISTALMYSFRQRSDTIVIDEPLYGYYLSTTRVRHPGDQDVLASMEQDGNAVISKVLLAPYSSPVVFFKNMAHHLTGLPDSFLSQMDHILLTRHPNDMLISLAKNLSQPILRDTGLKEQVDLLERIRANGQEPIVLESQEVLKNPQKVLSQVCDKLGIAFEDNMLSWPAGPKPEDGCWAPYWYANVHTSTGFVKPSTQTQNLPKKLEPLLLECLPFYEYLASFAIKAS